MIRLGFNNISLVTLTRAPKVTEDVSLDASTLFNELLESKFGTTVLLDAHNSRYEAAPKVELRRHKIQHARGKGIHKGDKGIGPAAAQEQKSETGRCKH